MTKNLILAGLLICVTGCVSRSQFRDRMDNMADVHTHDWMRLQRQINELEKKVEEPRPCEFKGGISLTTGVATLLHISTPTRPNWPCPYCSPVERSK